MARRRAARDAYAIIRLDWFDRPLDFVSEGNGPSVGSGPVDVTIKEVVLDQDEAEREVARLNRLNSAKGSRYYWQFTRLFSDGGSFGSE